jgi:hypothetical protein
MRTIDRTQSLANAAGLRSGLSPIGGQGMRLTSIVAAAGIVFTCCALAGAGGAPAPAQENSNWIEAQSLRELPAGIQAPLGVGLDPDNGGIADRDELRLNEVNVAVKAVPRRRFAVGTFSDGKAVVAIEQGGTSNSVWGLEFRQVGDTWEVTRCDWLRQRPRRAAELLAALDAGLPAEGWICPGPDRLTQVRQRPGA